MSQDRTAGDDIEVVRHEDELVVEHVPLARAADDPALGEAPRTPAGRLRDSMLSRFAARRQPAAVGAEEVKLELLEEQHEVVERVVPRERVRLMREVRSSQAPVSGAAREELVEITRQGVDERRV